MHIEPVVNYTQVERSILRYLFSSRQVFSQHYGLLQTYAFSDPYSKFFFRVAHENWQRCGEIPTQPILVDAVRRLTGTTKTTAIGALAEILGGAQPESPLGLIELLRQKGIRDSTLDAHLKAAQFLQQGDGEKAAEVMRVASTAGRVVRKPKKLLDGGWRPEVLKRRVPTGIYELDRVIGGIGHDDLAYVSAAKGVGKSTTCTQLAGSCVIQEEPVLYLDSENRGRLVQSRMVSRFTGIAYDAINGGWVTDEEAAFLDLWAERCQENIDKFFRWQCFGMNESSFADIEAMIMDCIADGFIPHYIIIDNPEHMKREGFETRKDSSQYAWLEKVPMALRGQIVDRYHVGVIATSQVNKEEELRGSAEKANIAQLWLHMRVGEDPDTKKPSAVGHREIDVKKNREGIANVTVHAMADLARCRISAYPGDEPDPLTLLETRGL